MKNHRAYAVIIAVMAMMIPGRALASMCQYPGQTLNFNGGWPAGTINITAPADSYNTGVTVPLSEWGTAATPQAAMWYCSPPINEISIIPSNIPANPRLYHEDGNKHVVYPTINPSVGYIAQYNISSTRTINALGWFPVNSDFQIKMSINPTSIIYASLRFRYVSMGVRLVDGEVTASAPTVSLLGSYNSTSDGMLVNLKSTANGRLNIVSRTCTINHPVMQSVRLPNISLASFTTPGQAVGANSSLFNFSVKCDSNVRVRATLSDAYAPENPDTANNVLRLDPNVTGSATGVGVQLFKQGQTTPMPLGPPRDTVGNPGQWDMLIGMTTYDNQVVSQSFYARYFQKGAVTTGKVVAAAEITFSYQ